MPLLDLIATPHPDGHRIDLSWAHADPAAQPGVRVVRRERTFPVTPDDGVVVADGTGLGVGTDALGRTRYRVTDAGLQGGTTYYYGLFPYSTAPLTFEVDRANRVAALAGTALGTADWMYALLPALYQRYDGAGQLRRFLDLPGGQLDLLHTAARALLDLYDPARVDGRLLPLLADWIGWKTDYRLEIDAQRNEIRRAPAVYQRVGMVPVVGATVKRISGWESRSKEFVHNVFASNRPPRLNVWGRRLDPDGTAASPDTLLSLDFAYEGRPAAATDAHGVRWLVYHTLRRGRWQLWAKTSPTFRLGADVRPSLDAPDVAALQRAFAAAGAALAADATVTPVGSLWRIDDPTNAEVYVVEAVGGGFTVYRTTADALDLAPSRPLNPGSGGHESHPAAALQGDALWVFWSVYDPGAGRWAIRYRLRRDGAWSEARPFTHGLSAPSAERRSPAATVDAAGGLWLCWLERARGGWRLRYNRHDGTGLGADPDAGWERDPAEPFPLDGPDDPRVEDDLTVLFHPDDAARPLWVLWARKAPTSEPHQTRWEVAYRMKASLDPAFSDWSAIGTLPKADELAHDREPCAHVEGGALRVYWSSDRAGSWALWRAALDLDEGAPWGAAELLGGDPLAAPYAQRNPLPLSAGSGTVLLYRSSESLHYGSSVYRATRTVDFRYAGATAVHTRNAALADLHGAFEDFRAYTYDTGTAGARTDADWVSRDTLGVYLEPDTADPTVVTRGVERLRRILPEFMPTTDRAVFRTRADAHTEAVYAYERPGSEPHFIAEHYADALTSPLTDGLPPDQDFADDLQ